jgi:hypothetical protein
MPPQYFISTRALRFPFTFTEADYDKVMITSATGNVESANLTSAQIVSLGRQILSDDGTTIAFANLTVQGHAIGRGGGNVATNFAVGGSALQLNTTGSNNVGCGPYALQSNTTGSQNTASGVNSLQRNMTGSKNTAAGFNAMQYNTTGTENCGFGMQAMYSITEGSNNVAVGSGALQVEETGNLNTAVGYNALLNNWQTSENVGVGASALEWNISGSQNTACGTLALRYNQTSSENVGVGVSALEWNGDGSQNTGCGAWALRYNETGNYNTAHGYMALYNTKSSDNVGVGGFALEWNTNGSQNTACGAGALRYNETGNLNTACGYMALSETTGKENVGIGASAFSSNTTGTYNIGLGSCAGRSNTSGSQNTVCGSYACDSNTTGSYNTAFGASALEKNTSNENVAIGYFALRSNTTGAWNTACGSYALQLTQAGAANTTFSNCTGLGYDARVSASNQVQIGNASTSTYTYGALNNRSDARDKADVRDTVLGLDFVQKLRPVDYRWDMRDDYLLGQCTTIDSMTLESGPMEEHAAGVYDILIGNDVTARIAYPGASIELVDASKEYASSDLTATCPSLPKLAINVKTRTTTKAVLKDGSKKRNRYHHGLIAQEVESIIQSTGIDFGGLQHHSIGGGEDIYTIGYSELFGPLIKAVQELATINQTMCACNATLSSDIDVLKSLASNNTVHNAILYTEIASLNDTISTMRSDIGLLQELITD